MTVKTAVFPTCSVFHGLLCVFRFTPCFSVCFVLSGLLPASRLDLSLRARSLLPGLLSAFRHALCFPLLRVSRFASCFPPCPAFADSLSAFRFGFAPAFLVLRSFCPIYSVSCLSFEFFAVILLKFQEKRAIRITFGVFTLAFLLLLKQIV